MSGLTNLAPSNYVGPQGQIERLLCRYLYRLIIASERIAIAIDADDESTFDAEFVLAPPRFWISVRILIAPNLWVGESYAAGFWYLRKGSLTDFLDVVRKEAPPIFKGYYELTAALRGFRYYLSQYLTNVRYTRKVRRHYEVDSRIYEMILDPEMVYTCGFFESCDQGLDVAQQNKLSLAITRLGLPVGPVKVLDIGCGWGATARALVRSHKHAEVCGLSISKGQIEWAQEHDGLLLPPDQRRRIAYRVEDYLDHHPYGTYDAVIVIGMIEHVGLGGYENFFRRLYGFLKPGGTAVIHTIASPAPGKPTNRWIDKHIFTGGYTPAISELIRAIEHQPFSITGLFIHRPGDYRRTIECWLNNFIENEATLAHYLLVEGETEGEIARFIRTWLFYLSGVRNMFSDDNPRSYQVVQACIRRK
jgi:cyclopropane-fatty-acyl-phospholipid synthase